MILPTAFKGSATWQYRHGQVTNQGEIHAGIDLYHPEVQPVTSVLSGTVRFAGPARGWGSLVVVDHGEITSRYGHVDGILVNAGDEIGEGTMLGVAGTGRGQFIRHLHYDLMHTAVLLTESRPDWSFYRHNLSNFNRYYLDPREFHPEIDAELTRYGW